MMSERQYRGISDDILLQQLSSYERLAVECRARGEFGLATYCRQQQTLLTIELNLRVYEIQRAQDRQLRIEDCC